MTAPPCQTSFFHGLGSVLFILFTLTGATCGRNEQGPKFVGMLAGPSSGWMQAETSPRLHGRPGPAGLHPSLRWPRLSGPGRPRSNLRSPCSWRARRGRGRGVLPFPSRPFPPRWRRRCRGPAGGRPAPLLRSAPLVAPRDGRCEYGEGGEGRGAAGRGWGCPSGQSRGGSEPLPLVAERRWRCSAPPGHRGDGSGAAGTEPPGWLGLRAAESAARSRVPAGMDAAIRIHRHALASVAFEQNGASCTWCSFAFLFLRTKQSNGFFKGLLAQWDGGVWVPRQRLFSIKAFS